MAGPMSNSEPPTPQTPAVLFLIFNRPDTTAEVFAAIRRARPTRLYVAADGPRPGRDGEAALCDQTRRIATAVDWPCNVLTLFRETNLGCGAAVGGAVSWFFEHEPEGIILEDDCLPDASFFPYCAELLERHRRDERIMCIAGFNSAPEPFAGSDSYTYSALPAIWGWASWRRAWAHFDPLALGSPTLRQDIRAVCKDKVFENTFVEAFARTASGELDTWDYVWNYCVWAQRGLTCIPRVNLVRNIGFGEDATHTTDADHPRGKLEARSLEFPLRHPATVARDRPFERLVIQHSYGIQLVKGPSLFQRARGKLKRILQDA